MACVSSTLLAHLGSGDHVVVGDELFVITRVLLEDDFPRRGIGVTPVDMTDLAAVEAAITPATKVLFFETATNPRLRVADIDALAALGHRHGLIVVADNTFLAPALLRPIEHGADLVVHAATKWLSGHGDAVSGAVTGSADAPEARSASRSTRSARPRARSRAGSCSAACARSRCARAQASDERAPAGGVPRRPAEGRVGPLPGPRLAPGPRASRRASSTAPAAAMLAFQPRGGVEGMAAFTDHLAAVRRRGQPGRRLHARLPAAEARRADPRLGRLRGRRRPDRGLHARPVLRRLTAARVDRAGRSASAERRRGGERRADREVDAAVDLVLRRPVEGLAAGRAASSASSGSNRTSDTVRIEPARTGRPFARSRIASRNSVADLHLDREVAAAAPARSTGIRVA